MCAQGLWGLGTQADTRQSWKKNAGALGFAVRVANNKSSWTQRWEVGKLTFQRWFNLEKLTFKVNFNFAKLGQLSKVGFDASTLPTLEVNFINVEPTLESWVQLYQHWFNVEKLTCPKLNQRWKVNLATSSTTLQLLKVNFSNFESTLES